VDNPPERYSPWISTGQFGGSVIHRYSLVDDVDIYHWIYRHAGGCRGARKPFKGLDIVFQNNIYWLHLPIFLCKHFLWCSNTRLSFLHDGFPWQQVFLVSMSARSFDLRSMVWPISNGLPWKSFTVTEPSSSFLSDSSLPDWSSPSFAKLDSHSIVHQENQTNPYSFLADLRP